VDGSWRRRWALVKESIRDSRGSFKHGFVIEGILANFVESVEDAEGRQQAEHMSSVTWQFDNFIIKQI